MPIIFHSAWFGWGSVILLMVMLGLLAFLRHRGMLKERAGIFIIAGIMLFFLLALTLNIE